MLGLIRTARWFVGTSTEFGPTLYFVSQFDSSLEKYFDDFVLNGKANLEKVWGNALAVRPARTRRLATSCSTSRAVRSRPWPVTTRFRASTSARSRRWPIGTRRRRSSSARYAGDGSLEDKVNAFFAELAKPYEFVRSGAAIDTDVVNEPQYTNVPERLGVKKAA